MKADWNDPTTYSKQILGGTHQPQRSPRNSSLICIYLKKNVLPCIIVHWLLRQMKVYFLFQFTSSVIWIFSKGTQWKITAAFSTYVFARFFIGLDSKYLKLFCVLFLENQHITSVRYLLEKFSNLTLCDKTLKGLIRVN